MPFTLDKNMCPHDFEEALYQAELASFKSTKSSSNPFCLMMPPPNVTGVLHLGHALTYTLQDILVRFERMHGKDTLWQPGTDHAGIATQMVVERNLEKEGQSRHTLGRENFLEKVWQWKETSGSAIVDQQKALRISADWDRSRFTMDEDLNRAVRKVFVNLYNDGLIYRATRLVNWDYKLQTAISDLEVVTKDQKIPFYTIRYYVEGDSSRYIDISTTRPETLFGDVAIAVNPEDERYRELVGKKVIIPIINRAIPIITDEYSDPTKGTGAVKITPAHDFNDAEVGKRHALQEINVFDANAKLNQAAPQEYQGLFYKDARKKLLKELQENDLLITESTITSPVPYGDRSDVEIQPWLMEQWFVDAKTLAKPALKAVKDGKTKFFPEQWANTYYDWLENIQPWCVSRQIWWGHRIPAWSGPDGHIFVAEDEKHARNQAQKHYGKDLALTQDTDVLDTWFSSALWPFTTLGWPEKTPELASYYPTDVLVTGFDIIFFWVARMMMMGLYFMDDVPFKKVYVHALIRDEKGQKMSKSKGNVIDPMEMINLYGSDVVRFTLAAMSVPGRDLRMSEGRISGYRNFATKIWNSVRFLQHHEATYDKKFTMLAVTEPLHLWIHDALNQHIQLVNKHISEFRFDLAAQQLYKFLWQDYCDFYLESIKPLLAQEATKGQAQNVAIHVMLTYLRTLFPIMPSLSNYLSQALADTPIDVTAWPEALPLKGDFSCINTLDDTLRTIRSMKGLLNIGQQKIGISIHANGSDIIMPYQEQLIMMARLSSIHVVETLDLDQGIPFVSGKVQGTLNFDSKDAMQKAYAIIQNTLASLEVDIKKLSQKVNNDKFKSSKPDLWAKENELLTQKQSEHNQLTKLLHKPSI